MTLFNDTLADMGTQPATSATRLAEAIERAHATYAKSITAKARLPRLLLDGATYGLGMAIGGTIVFGFVLYILGHFVVVPRAQAWVTQAIERATSREENP